MAVCREGLFRPFGLLIHCLTSNHNPQTAALSVCGAKMEASNNSENSGERRTGPVKRIS